MSIERATVGRVTITSVLDLDADDEPMRDAFPAIPEAAVMASKDEYPELFGTDDRWRLKVRAWILEHPDGLAAVDTGMGAPGFPPNAEWFPPGRFLDSLDAVGVRATDVDTVVISHVHNDHIGATVTKGGEPAFPNARYLIQRADVEWLQKAAATDEDDHQVWDLLIAPLEKGGLLELVDGDRRLTGEVELHHTPGHTPGHQVVRIASEGHHALITADAFNHPLQIANPGWSSASDDDPDRANATRAEILDELASRPGTTVVPTHFGTSFGLVVPGDDASSRWVATEGGQG
jgi:glyoxylase-like metal-dependent hydrolase (beta-lactamase superfamily II)